MLIVGNFMRLACAYFYAKNVEKMRKTIFTMLIAVSMIMLVITPVFVSANALVLGNEQSYKLPLKGFATPLQWGNRGGKWLPDLTVDQITFDPPSPKEREPVTISATIKNIGWRSAYDVKVEFYDGDPQSGTSIGFVTISRIRARRSAVATTSWTAEAGTHDIYVVADPDKTISESNEDNNVAYNTIVVETVTPNHPPIADANGPYTGIEDAEVTFDGSESYDPDGDPLTYHWDFGDGSTGTGVSPKHAYTAGGTYTVTLIVNDDKVDSDPATTTATISEVNDPPVANAGPDQTVLVNTTVLFNGAGSYDPDGTIASYEWNFGDGDTGTGETPTHNYTAVGTYTVNLTVTDNDGATAWDTCIITVTEAAVVDKWALLIGISDYEGTENDLWNPHRDALDMYEALTTLYGFPEGNIHMLLNENAIMDTILTEIDWLNSVENSPDDVVVFFFCGHGYRTSEWNRQWRNADGDRESDRRDEFIVSYDLWAYADGYLAKKFAAFDSKNIFLWFGSCYSGGMIWDVTYWAKDFSGVICTACKENQYGFDVYAFGNTLFGEYYVDKGLLQGLDGAVTPGTVTVEAAFYYAKPLVEAWAAARDYESVPQMFDSDTASDFYL